MPRGQAAGQGIYSLARNGLAHVFVMKGPLLVTKGVQSAHLTRTAAGEVVIDAVQLADDFASSYPHFKGDVLLNPGPPSQRVQEIWAAYLEQAHGAHGVPGDMRFFGSLPLPASPVPQQSVSAAAFSATTATSHSLITK